MKIMSDKEISDGFALLGISTEQERAEYLRFAVIEQHNYEGKIIMIDGADPENGEANAKLA